MSFQNHKPLYLRLLCLLALLTSTQVNGWGHEGHCIVANIAYSRLSLEVQDAVKSILNFNASAADFGAEKLGGKDDPLNSSPLAAVASWADKVRFTSRYHWSTPLHFVDVRDDEVDGGCPCTRNIAAGYNSLLTGNVGAGDESSCSLHSSCSFVYDRDCVKDFCAVGGIVNYTTRLVDNFQKLDVTSSARLLRGSQLDSSEEGLLSGWPAKEALMFVVHFIGDIHQPLHASRGSDRGGNTIHVHFDGSETESNKQIFDARTGAIQKKGDWNLHSVWDDGLIDLAIDSLYNSSQLDFQQAVIDLVEEAESSGLIDSWLQCADGLNFMCPSAWAEESFEDALRWAYSDENGLEVVEGAMLSEEYVSTRLHVVKRRLAAAGVRLGAVLENALGQNKGSGSSHPKLAEMLTSMPKPMLLLS